LRLVLAAAAASTCLQRGTRRRKKAGGITMTLKEQTAMTWLRATR
jgi:hypothetical protein